MTEIWALTKKIQKPWNKNMISEWHSKAHCPEPWGKHDKMDNHVPQTKAQTALTADEDVEHPELPFAAGGVQNGSATVEAGETASYKWKLQLLCNPATVLLGI